MPKTKAKKKSDNLIQIADKEVDARKLCVIDPLFWIEYHKVRLSGGAFDFKRHPYQLDWFSCNARRQVFKKGAQLGISEAMVLRVIHGLIHGKYPKGYLYLFPTRDDVTDFSKGRFQPIISDNDVVRRYVKDTDAANIKRIGNSM